VIPAAWAIWPACCAGMTLQTSTFSTMPSIVSVMASGSTSTLPPPKSGPIRVIMPG
jgi:hypothetical protein